MTDWLTREQVTAALKDAQMAPPYAPVVPPFTSTMRYGSVCSGIEAATVAWHGLGWKPAFFSEIEKFPSAVLAHHYPDVPNYGDMTRFSEWPDAALDVLVGGTPCQSFSVAGLRKGLADPRGNLMLTYLAIAERYRPRWLVWENVPGVLSSNGGRDFGALLGGLGQLGYGWAYRVLDAQFFGVAQRRRRVFVVGHLGDWRPAAAVLFERHSLQGNPASRREKGKGAAADVAGSLTASGRGVERTGETRGQDPVVAVPVYAPEVSPVLTAHGSASKRMNASDEAFVAQAVDFQSKRLEKEPITGTIDAAQAKRAGYGVLEVAHTLRANHDASEDGTGRGTPLVPVSVALRGREGGATAELGDDKAGTLRASGGGGDKAHVLAPTPAQPIPINTMAALRPQGSDENRQTFGIGEPGDPMPTLSKAHSHAVAQPVAYDRYNDSLGEVAPTVQAANTGRVNGVIQSMAVRRLTPRECERLQGFPDDYTLIPHRGKPAADGPRYKALGNSMAVPVMAWIGRRIQQVEDILGGAGA